MMFVDPAAYPTCVVPWVECCVCNSAFRHIQKTPLDPGIEPEEAALEPELKLGPLLRNTRIACK